MDETYTSTVHITWVILSFPVTHTGSFWPNKELALSKQTKKGVIIVIQAAYSSQT